MKTPPRGSFPTPSTSPRPGVIGLGANLAHRTSSSSFATQLHADGKQLLLLFEDIAIARGLQLDLVDAMTTAAQRKVTSRFAPCGLRSP